MALSAQTDRSDQRLDEHAPGAGAATWRSVVAALRDEDQTPLVQFLLRVVEEQAQRLEQQTQRLAALEAERAGRQRPKRPASNSNPSALSKPAALPTPARTPLPPALSGGQDGDRPHLRGWSLYSLLHRGSPPIMNTAALLADLATLTHDARMRHLMELGQLAHTDVSITLLLDQLEQGGYHERLLALQSCYGSQDGARALRALNDPSRSLQGRALYPLALFGTDEQAQEGLRRARPKHRLALLRFLRGRRRQDPIDAFLTELAENDLPALALVLPFGSLTLVTRLLQRCRHLGGSLFWKRLARRHPEKAVATLRSELQQATSADPRLCHEARVVVEALPPHLPDLTLALIATLSAHQPLGWLFVSLQQLSRVRPTEMTDLILGSLDAVQVRLDGVAHRLDLLRLQALLEHRPGLVANVQQWFRRLPPEQRQYLFQANAQRWRDSDGCVPFLVVRSLPEELRHAEARRHLDLPTLATRPTQRLPFAALLPWAEATVVLKPWLNHPEGELRGAALHALAGTVRYERVRLTELLALVAHRRHEQDPVRLRMLTGLAELPPGIWRTEHLEPLSQVLNDALAAADLSHQTATQAERLVVTLLPLHPDWGAEWLARLVKERGHIHIGDLQNRLNDQNVRRLAPALLPVLRTWQTRERQGHIAAVAASLGRRLPAFPELVEILEEEIQQTRTEWIAATLLGLLSRHCRERLTELIPGLLKKDPSWATQPIVYQYLHRRRQDLLTPFLGQRAYKGRFSTGKTRFVLPLLNGFFRWTPQQQATFQATLTELVRTKKGAYETPTLLLVIRQMAALPAPLPQPLVRLARSKRLAVQEAALRALGRLDSGEGIPTLMEAMEDDRARVAIYALRSAVLAMPVDRAVAVLGGFPQKKVTVAKECVRLLGDLPTETAFQELQRLEATTLHRDVRVALLRALWGHLERSAAWTILERAVDSPDPALMNSVVRIPADRLSSTSQGHLLGLLGRLLTHPEPLIRLQVLVRCADLPVPDPHNLLLPRLFHNLTSAVPDERGAAARAVLCTCRSQEADALAERLLEFLPNRRAVVSLVSALSAAVSLDRRRLVPVARAVLATLATDPLAICLYLQLALVTLPWEEVLAILKELAKNDRLHADALQATRTGVEGWTRRTDAADLEKLELALARSRDERLRWLALAALISQAVNLGGWTAARLERLRRYREDATPLVGGSAHFTLPVEEEETGR